MTMETSDVPAPAREPRTTCPRAPSAGRSSRGPVASSCPKASTPPAWARSPARPGCRRGRSTSTSTARRRSSPRSSPRASAPPPSATSAPSTPRIRTSGRVLTTFASGLIAKVTEPEHMALLRMVIAAADKFPSVARTFYEAGPAHGARCLTGYLEEQNRRGRLAIPDPATSAWQFLGMCTHALAVGDPRRRRADPGPGARRPPRRQRRRHVPRRLRAPRLRALSPRPAPRAARGGSRGTRRESRRAGASRPSGRPRPAPRGTTPAATCGSAPSSAAQCTCTALPIRVSRSEQPRRVGRRRHRRPVRDLAGDDGAQHPPLRDVLDPGLDPGLGVAAQHQPGLVVERPVVAAKAHRRREVPFGRAPAARGRRRGRSRSGCAARSRCGRR